MKRASLIFAAVIVVIANALALLHVARNRSGNPSAEITLTNRELQSLVRSSEADNSAVTLRLQWVDPDSRWPPEQVPAPPRWLDREKLQTLGFDCSMNPEMTGATTFYQRQRLRQVFVALEYDGPAWKAWSEADRRSTPQFQLSIQPGISVNALRRDSHLVAIDADLDHYKLRARHPERTSVLILPAVVGITLDPLPYPGMGTNGKPPAKIIGHIQQVPAAISIPRPFSDEFRRRGLATRVNEETDAVGYRVRLRYGAELEPWVVGLEFEKGR